MFKTRAISAVFIVIISALSIYLGGIVLGLIMLAISLIAFYELSRATGIHSEDKKINEIEALSYISITVFYVMTYFELADLYMGIWLVLSVLILLAAYVFAFPKIEAKNVMTAVFCIIYAPVMFSFILRLRAMDYGFWLVWLVFIASWVSDTCAYCVGMLFGKHKLAPKLSPKKSIEGAIGGIFGAAIVGALYGWLLSAVVMNDLSQIWICALIGGAGSIVSQIGDLTASGIKRQHNIKDYGHLIPGHGGIMDRFDSVITAAPMIYILAMALM